MKMMSFSMTTAQVRARTKDVTRRAGWRTLAPGALLLAVEKCMGLKRGERVVPLGVIRVKSVRQERLDELVAAGRDEYGAEEMRREGFPGMDPQDFLLRFPADVDPDALVTRIEFEYVD